MAEIAEGNASDVRVDVVERPVKGVDWKTLTASLTDKFGFSDRQMSAIAFQPRPYDPADPRRGS